MIMRFIGRPKEGKNRTSGERLFVDKDLMWDWQELQCIWKELWGAMADMTGGFRDFGANPLLFKAQS